MNAYVFMQRTTQELFPGNSCGIVQSYVAFCAERSHETGSQFYTNGTDQCVFPSENPLVCNLPVGVRMSLQPETPRTKKLPLLEGFSVWVSRATGSTPAFVAAAGAIVLWLMAGPFFDFSAGWQLVINTGTTIITFLMVFVIQRAQNKESVAIQLKLNELVAAHELSSNRLVCVEDMTEHELHTLQKYYRRLAEMSKGSENLQESHSIEEAEQWHSHKTGQISRRTKKNKNNDSPKGEHSISSSQ
jgi:low affinity Fe/Cu permease